MLMIKSKLCSFNNQEDGILRQMIRLYQVLNSSESPSMSTLSVSFWKIESKLNVLCSLQNQIEAFFNNQEDITLRLTIWSDQFLNFFDYLPFCLHLLVIPVHRKNTHCSFLDNYSIFSYVRILTNFTVFHFTYFICLTLLLPEIKWIRPVRGGTSTWEVITPWILPRFSWNFHV